MTEEISTIRTPNTEHRTPNTEPQCCPQFSIIVPAYNCEKYITKCLGSLINQDIPARNYEIIITDDGSTDQTGKILDSYAEKFPFIHVTHTANHGEGSARNTALEHSSGEYLLWCDADDFVSPQLISVMTRALEVFGHPDAVIYRYFKNMPSSGWPVYDVQGMKPSDGRPSGSEELCIRIMGIDEIVGGFVWNKCVRRELVGDIRMDKTLRICEDQYFLLQLFTARTDARICMTDYVLYCYTEYPDIVTSRNPLRKYTKDGMGQHVIAFEKELLIPNLSPKVAEQVRGRIYWGSLGTLIKRIVKPSKEVYSHLRANIRKYAGDYYLRSSDSLKHKIAGIIIHILVLLHLHI